jgi:hypothetical protein
MLEAGPGRRLELVEEQGAAVESDGPRRAAWRQRVGRALVAGALVLGLAPLGRPASVLAGPSGQAGEPWPTPLEEPSGQLGEPWPPPLDGCGQAPAVDPRANDFVDDPLDPLDPIYDPPLPPPPPVCIPALPPPLVIPTRPIGVDLAPAGTGLDGAAPIATPFPDPELELDEDGEPPYRPDLEDDGPPAGLPDLAP